MKDKTKYGVLLLCIFFSTLFVGYGTGYSAGYHEAEEIYEDSLGRCIDAIIECNDEYGRCVDLVGKCSDTLNKCNEQLKKEKVNYKLELLEKGYNNGWWSYNWSKEDIKESRSYDESVSWICYSENCTEEQINEFIELNYTYYDDLSDCYIWRSG